MSGPKDSKPPKKRAAKRTTQAAEPALPGVNDAAPSHLAPDESVDFPIVGLGASAGGLAPLSDFFTAVPATTGMAFVVVQHLHPDQPSMLAEILGRVTRMPVATIVQNTQVEPDHVYVIPSGKSLVIGNGLLQLSPRVEERGQHRSVDHFLRSLAEEMGHKAIGVILSGTASDGTLGLEEVKAAGGITFAQDDTAEQTSMPRSAIAAGVVDFVLPADEIAREIGRIASHPLVHDATLGDLPEGKEAAVMDVLEHLRTSSGVDFSNYKYNTLRRRIARRIVLHKLEGVEEYLRFISESPGELEALYTDILINVTSFFRNPEAYEALKKDVFPKLAALRNRHEPVRVWALGCSTGEEAYSVAMTFTEFLEESGKRVGMQIFATDLNGAGIDKARAGIYPKGITQDVSPERLRRFFVEIDGSYRVSKPIRDMCVFARQNVLSDPPFSRIDLIACRNLLIYLEPVLQQRLIPLLHYALRDDGFLWLGGSETIGTYRELFGLEDAKHKIYAKKSAHRDKLVIPQQGPRDPRLPVPSLLGHAVAPVASTDPQRDADRLLLGQYAPPGVIVNSQLEIVQFRGDTSVFLGPAPGRASLLLLKMLREGLAMPVRSAIEESRKDGIGVRTEGLRIRYDGGYRDVTIVVLPLKGPSTPAGTMLVLFEEPSQSTTSRMREMGERNDAERAIAAAGQGESGQKEVARLHIELDATRDYLQSVIEQQEAANEELQSANEEVQSANEELQSINEELETSKEEIQSSNEELATVNDELQHRNHELSQSNNDLTNLLASVQMPIVMLGPDLRIRRMTPAAEKLLNLIPADIGRPLTDLKVAHVPDLEAMIHAAIDDVAVQEREIQGVDGHWYLLRVRPYRTLENRIDGAVLIFVDVDAIKVAEQGLRESEQRFELLANSAPVLIWVSDPDRPMFVNKACEIFLGVTEAEILAGGWKRFIHPDDSAYYLGAFHEAVERKVPFEAQCRLRRADGTYRWMQSVAHPRMKGKALLGYVGSSYDITGLKEADALMREIDRAKNEFLATLAHELRNPLASIRNATHIVHNNASTKDDVDNAYEIMGRQTRNMVRMVDDLLDVSRIDHGKVTLRVEDLELNDVVRSAMAATEHERSAHSQVIGFTASRDPIRIRGDAARLDQLLGNLLVNASKFTEAGGHIGVVVAVAPGASMATVTLRDDGAGIDPADLPRVFDLFVQSGTHSATGRTGMGIGLTLARRLAQLHGGTIRVHSEGLGRGSEFVVTLPIAANLSRPAPKVQPAPPRRPAQRVMVVDDNVDAAESQAALLRLAGHEVRVAHNGREALRLASDFDPHAMVLDIAMPGMSGYELARELRATSRGRGTMLIAVTGFGQPGDIVRTREAGFNHHVTKPVEPDILLGLIAGEAD